MLGPRFSLDPSEVRAVFPPEGSLGEHSNVLPHIILNRATLPWERSAAPGANAANDPPWLALLVFDQGEEPTPQAVTLGDLGFPKPDVQGKLPTTWGASNMTGFYTGLTPESGQLADDLAQLITVSADLLKAIVPTRIELDWLAHVRQATDSSGAPGGDPFAVLFANRLPTPNGRTTVHLVSLEELYKNGAFAHANASGNVSLVSLKSWSFACVSPDHDFKNLLLNLDAGPFRLPARGPHSELYLQQGLAPFAHAMRQGNRSVSWYRGPLLPGENPSAEIQLPVPNADSLTRYYTDTGMFDMTYAAAWELGRLLALQNKRVSIDLFN